MSASRKRIKPVWTDAEDAPELTGAELDRPGGVWKVGGRRVSRERGRAVFREMMGKKPVNMLLDRSVIAYFKAKAHGRGYQTLINETLRRAIERETLEAALRRVLREEIGSR